MSHEDHHHPDLETQNTAGTTPNTYEAVSQGTTQVYAHPSNFQPLGQHDHPHPHKHRTMNSTQKRLIVGFTVFMPINVLILEYFWLTEPIKENEFEYYFSLCSLYIFFSFSMVSYYYAIKIKNTVMDKQPTPCDHYYLPEIYKNDKRCDAPCNKWKPMRAHHCRQCGNCSLRMDHHCPWTVNCVGARNHKSFYLFCIYMGLGSSQYCYRTIYFFITESDKGTLWDYPTLFYVYWFSTSMVLFPIAMMLVSLMIFHSCAALTNVTTLENMQGTNVNCCNNGFNDQYFSRTTNLYDRGIFANYANFLGNSLFLFWFPTEVHPEKDGTEFPMTPSLTIGEMVKLSGKREIYVSEEYYEEKRKTFEEFCSRAEMECKDKNLQISGKIFRHYEKFEAKKDNSIENPPNNN